MDTLLGRSQGLSSMLLKPPLTVPPLEATTEARYKTGDVNVGEIRENFFMRSFWNGKFHLSLGCLSFLPENISNLPLRIDSFARRSFPFGSISAYFQGFWLAVSFNGVCKGGKNPGFFVEETFSGHFW